MSRAFGISAPANPDDAAPVAEAAESLGYSSIWTNDTPFGDGIKTAIAMLEATTSIRVGIGVVALDRRPPESLVPELDRLSADRTVLGVGAGFSAKPLEQVVSGVRVLRSVTACKIGLAAMGPRMCRLAGEIADLVLLNWMTPERIQWARARIEESERGRPPEVEAYVRFAAGTQAERLIAEEGARYSALPHYARHFRAMGSEPAALGIAADTPEEAARAVSAYEAVLDETVLRAIPPSPTPGAWIELAKLAAPRSTG